MHAKAPPPAPAPACVVANARRGGGAWNWKRRFGVLARVSEIVERWASRPRSGIPSSRRDPRRRHLPGIGSVRTTLPRIVTLIYLMKTCSSWRRMRLMPIAKKPPRHLSLHLFVQAISPILVFPLSDGFNTLRSLRSHVTEVSSVMTANVSEDDAVAGAEAPLGGASPLPPRPVSTLQQHDYSNIQQPAPMMPQGNNSGVPAAQVRFGGLLKPVSVFPPSHQNAFVPFSAQSGRTPCRPLSLRVRTRRMPAPEAAVPLPPTPSPHRPPPPRPQPPLPLPPRMEPSAEAQCVRGLLRTRSRSRLGRRRRRVRVVPLPLLAPPPPPASTGPNWPRCKTSSIWSRPYMRTTSCARCRPGSSTKSTL